MTLVSRRQPSWSLGLRKRGCVPIPWVYKGLKDEDGRRVKDVGDVASDDDLLSAYHRTIGRGFTC